MNKEIQLTDVLDVRVVQQKFTTHYKHSVFLNTNAVNNTNTLYLKLKRINKRKVYKNTGNPPNKNVRMVTVLMSEQIQEHDNVQSTHAFAQGRVTKARSSLDLDLRSERFSTRRPLGVFLDSTTQYTPFICSNVCNSESNSVSLLCFSIANGGCSIMCEKSARRPIS